MKNIDQMPAGREMDALVAERVMGKHVEFVEQFGGRYEVGKPLPGTPYVLKDGREAHSIKPYSTSIADAWGVLEKISPKEKEQGLFVGREDGHYKVYHIQGHDMHWLLSAPTAPLAICRAALKAAL